MCNLYTFKLKCNLIVSHHAWGKLNTYYSYFPASLYKKERKISLEGVLVPHETS